MFDNQCSERVYNGSQHDRLIGRQCRREAQHRVLWPNGKVQWLCTQHARKAVQLGARSDV